MEFEINHRSQEMRKSVYVFPGDEQVSVDEYQECIGVGYVSSLATIIGATERYGLEVDTETFERWKRISAAAHHIDSFLDESNDRQEAYERYMQGIAYHQGRTGAIPDTAEITPRLKNSIILMDNAVSVLSPQRHDRLLGLAQTIGDISQRKTVCIDAQEYTRLLRKEGISCGLIISESASDHVRSQPAFELFAIWAVNALEFGTLQDSLKDLRMDANTGLTGVEFNIYNSLIIALSARRSFSALTRNRLPRSATIASLRRYRRFYK